MPLDERDYVRGAHPPACTCATCAERRVARIRSRRGSLVGRLVRGVRRVLWRR